MRILVFSLSNINDAYNELYKGADAGEKTFLLKGKKGKTGIYRLAIYLSRIKIMYIHGTELHIHY